MFMPMKPASRLAIPLCAAAILLSPLAAREAGAEPGVNVGVLTCRDVPGTRYNLIVHSSVKLTCVFHTPSGSERYGGRTGIGLGADLNWSRRSEIAFTVLMATSDLRIGAHALSGTFVGGKASVSAGYGVGAAVLVGAGAKNISLQPFALEGGIGLGAAAGLSYLTLEPAGA